MNAPTPSGADGDAGGAVRVRAAMKAAAVGLAAAAAWMLFGRDAWVPCAGCNVVLISIDTLRADHVGAYGYARPTTPRIDALAGRAVVFLDAIGQSAWTRPAHASMLTGLYPTQHGIVAIRGDRVLPLDVDTLPAALSRAGYRTAAFTGGGNMSAHFGFGRGFAVYRDDGRRIEDHVAPLSAWLDEAPDAPFFALVHGFDAHKPYKSRRRDRRALGLAPERPPAIARACRRKDADVAPLIDAYDAAVHRADGGVGALLDMLEARGLASRTIVVVTSDHGEELLDHGSCFHVRTLNREILRVPLIVSVPRVAPRSVHGVVPASVSISPTILELVGVRPGLPGPSLAPILAGAAPAFGYVVSETETRVTMAPRSGPVRALTGDTEKIVTWATSGRTEYYDLVADPEERRPLLRHDRVSPLLARLETWAGVHAANAAVPASSPMPPKLARELRALGYVH